MNVVRHAIQRSRLFLRLELTKRSCRCRRDPFSRARSPRRPHASSDESRDLLEARLGVRGPSDAIIDHRGALQRGIPRTRILQDAIGLQVARPEDGALRATAVRRIVESSKDRRARASEPVLSDGRPICVNGLNSKPSNSLTASPSKPQRTSDSLGRNFIGFGVDSSLMLLPLKMIMSTIMGGNMARAASVDGVPRRYGSKPSADAATEFNAVSPRNRRNLPRRLAQFR